MRWKGCTKAWPFMKSKLVKIGIRFYTVVNWYNDYAYLHDMQEKGSRSSTGVINEQQ